MKAIIKKIILFFYKLMTVIFPIDKKCIVFESNLGRNYTGNIKAIYEEMVSLGMDKTYKCIWIFEDTNTAIIGEAKRIKRSRIMYYYYMSVMHILVTDCRQPMYIIKRNGASFIQTWHGTPLKKLALDMDDVSMSGEINIEKYKTNFKNNAATWDYLVSQNKFSTNTFRRAFAYNKEILEIGYPRNDVLFSHNNLDYINKIKKQMGIPLDKKVILYAPTWRDDQFYSNGKYKFNAELDFDKFRDSFSDEYIMLIKYHYLVVEKINWDKYKGFIFECNVNYDISILYLIADLLITDYSSVMFDYSLLNRPMFFFAYDLENYRQNLRGFYFDFVSEAPGPISQTTKELIEDIKNYDYSKYKSNYEEFKNKYNHADDGNASRFIADLIDKKIKGA